MDGHQRQPPPGTYVLYKGELSFYLSPVLNGNTIETGLVDVCVRLHQQPFAFIPVQNGVFRKSDLIHWDYSGPFAYLPHQIQAENLDLYAKCINAETRYLVKLYFRQGPQKATLCFIWCAKGLVHRDVIQKIARLVWDSRSDMHLWAAANRFHMPY